MIERAKKVITSLVLSLVPKIFLRLSMKSFPIFLKTSQTSAMRMTKLTFSSPKKKIEFANGRVLESFVRRNSEKVRIPKKILRRAIVMSSNFLFLRSFKSSESREFWDGSITLFMP